MAFLANARVRVTSQHSEHRKRYGTVVTPAAQTAHGFNEVRLDHFPPGKTFNFCDKELGTTNFAEGKAV